MKYNGRYNGRRNKITKIPKEFKELNNKNIMQQSISDTDEDICYICDYCYSDKKMIRI